MILFAAMEYIDIEKNEAGSKNFEPGILVCYNKRTKKYAYKAGE